MKVEHARTGRFGDWPGTDIDAEKTSRGYINRLKQMGNGGVIKALNDLKDSTELLKFLENLGSLPRGFDGSPFAQLLNHKSASVRYWAAKSLGKLRDIAFLDQLRVVACEDQDSMVRREAVSSIGRIRKPQAIHVLLRFLHDSDPKIVVQAIRGLLVFKGRDDVDNELREMVNHPNEFVEQVVRKEYFCSAVTHASQPHAQTHSFLKNVVVNGDVREVLDVIPDDSIHLTFTSPPYYNARDYSIYPSYKAYLSFLTDVFKKLYRVTKEGRFFVLNTSPVIIPRVSRQHSSKRYPIPFDIHHFLVEIGWEFIDDIIWQKPEASVKNRNAGFLQHRKPLGYKPNAITEYLMVYRKKTERLLDWNMRQYDSETVNQSKISGDYETSNVWSISPTFDRRHSAVFPVELCTRVISFYSYRGDLVFDPFAGSGTMGVAARQNGRCFLLAEKERQYFEVIRRNLGRKPIRTCQDAKFFSVEEFSELEKQ